MYVCLFHWYFTNYHSDARNGHFLQWECNFHNKLHFYLIREMFKHIWCFTYNAASIWMSLPKEDPNKGSQLIFSEDNMNFFIWVFIFYLFDFSTISPCINSTVLCRLIVEPFFRIMVVRILLHFLGNRRKNKNNFKNYLHNNFFL